jgi:uncharacterized membrane-anchored protein YhcB (DUF1043 family)
MLAIISVEAWVGLIAIPIGLAIVTLLMRLTSQQSGTNVRLDGIKTSLDSHGTKIDKLDERVNVVEKLQVRHDLFWETLRGQDQSCHRTNDNSAAA